MDIYDYLKTDHERVAQLFKQFEDTDIIVRKEQIVALIAQELTLHAESEQATFYKVLEQFETFKEDVLHGEKEHQDIKAQLAKVVQLQILDATWIKDVEKLKELVEHHVNEEEGTIFKQAKKVLSNEDAYEIKEKMHFLKQTLLLQA